MCFGLRLESKVLQVPPNFLELPTPILKVHSRLCNARVFGQELLQALRCIRTTNLELLEYVSLKSADEVLHQVPLNRIRDDICDALP